MAEREQKIIEEIEKTISFLSIDVKELELSGRSQTEQCFRLRGALEEVDRLYSFCKNQIKEDNKNQYREG